MHPVGDQVMYVAIGFQDAIHREYRSAKYFGTLFLAQAGPHHDIDKTGLVLQGQENGAAGGHGALAHRDQAAGADAGAVRQDMQFTCGDGSPAAQDRPQQCNRVAAQGQAGAGVVGAGVVYLRGWADLATLVALTAARVVALRNQVTATMRLRI
jgi:osmotically-inducible protein OsmY